MEGLPRIPMISLELKESTETPNLSSLQNYIESHYDERSANYKNSFKEFLDLRKTSISNTGGLANLTCMKRYFCQLQLLKQRFPLSKDSAENSGCSINWSWEDSHSNSTVSLSDIRLEEASILYNIASLHCNLGSVEKRIELDSTKTACTHFQYAAGGFQLVLEQYTPLPSADLECDVLRYLNLLMLAQAHECVLEKSMVDQRRANISAKISFQISDLYKQCEGLLQSDNIGYSVGSKEYKLWKRTCVVKESLYNCLSCYYMALAAEDGLKYGEIIAWLKMAKEKLDKCSKQLKEMKSVEAEETIRFVQDVVNGKLESAKKDNDFIYYDKVPEPDMLPQIKGAMLLKGLTFDVNDQDICGQDIFKSLIPMETHISSSIYSEKKAEILRNFQAEVEAKNAEIDKFLVDIHWSNDFFTLTDSKVPQDLFNSAAFIAANPAEMENIKRTMQDISSISIEVEESLELLSNTMRNANIDKKLIIWKKYEKEYSEFISNFEDAKESNNQLREAFSCTLNDFKSVNQPIEQVVDGLPTLKTVSQDSETVGLLEECKRLMGKIEEMKNQRFDLITKLKTDMIADDITQLLLGIKTDSEQNKIISESLKKYDETTGYLRQNMCAQSNIIDAVVEHNAKIADINAKIIRIKNERESYINRIVLSFKMYKNLLNKGEEGIDFYRKLGTKVLKLQKNIDLLIPKSPDESEIKEMKVLEKEESVINSPLFEPPGKSIISQKSDAEINSDFYSFPPLPVSNTGPRLKDYLKERKSRHSLSDTPSVRNIVDKSQEKPSSSILNTNQYPYMPWGYYGPPCQGVYNANYAVSRPRDQDCEFRITQNIQLPAASSEVGCSIYPNYSSLPRPNYSQPSSTSATCSLAASIGNLSSSTGFSLNQFTIPYQQQQFYNPNVISMAHSFGGRSSIPLHESHTTDSHSNDSQQYYHSVNFDPNYFQYQNQLPNQNPSSIYSQNVHYNESISENSSVHFQQGNYYSQPTQVTNQLPSTSTSPNTIAQHNPTHQNSQSYYAETGNVASTSNPQNYLSNQPQNNPANPNTQPYYAETANVASTSNPQNYLSNQPQNSTTSPNSQTFYTGDPQNYSNNMFSIPQNNPSHSNFELYSSGATNMSPTSNPQHYPNYNSTQNNYYTNTPLTSYQTPVSNMNYYDNSTHGNSSISSPQQKDFTKDSLNSFSEKKDFPFASNCPKLYSNYLDKSQSNTDLLSSSPTNNINQEVCRPILEPMVITKQEIEDQKEEKRRQIYRKQTSGSNHPLNDNLVLNKFISDAERFMKRANEILDTSSNNKALEQHWTQLSNKARLLPKKSSAIAKCSPMKNRVQDSVPYDENRVTIKDGKDDYVNASHILLQNIDECLPRFISFQSPLTNTVSEYWTAVFEQGCELLVQLAQPCDKDDSSKGRVISYWPDTKGQFILVGSKFEISVQSLKEKAGWSERILLMKHLKSNQSRSIWHFQVHNVSNKLPKSNDEFLSFVTELCGYYRQQRSLTKPIGISCMNGSSVCGVMILLTTALTIMDITGLFPDIEAILMTMWSQRKNLVDDKHQLAFVYKAISKASSDMLSKRNIVIGPGRFVSVNHSTISDHSSSLNTTVSQSVVPSILDSLFTTQHLQLSELTSAISKWTVKVDDKVSEINSVNDDTNCLHLDSEEKTVIKQDIEQNKKQFKKLKDIELPSSLKYLENPSTIDFTPTPSDKRKITKKEFEEKINNKGFNKQITITDGSIDNKCDPFKSLDPIYNNQ